MKKRNEIYQKLTLVAALIGSLSLAGCAGNSTIAAEKIAAAEKSIQQANNNDAASNAAVELKSAQDHLAQARAAMDKKDYDKAAGLAESASADADLAQAKATTAKSKKAAADMRESVNALRRELNQSQTR
jgi:hypothetical protein